ncbi:aldolase citrate lyase family [Fusarium albosuccineum]|uniref:Aldolase citrate lyase family n=1 Tax=Fusarium albosuccineum TaxID=1237068 RepID=A0A8H4PB58_9HYPO|nr:aldolase citrate lyase family [Fusarium albosuccineum]
MSNHTASPVDASGKTRLRQSLERAKDRKGPSLGQWLALPGYTLARTIAPLGEDWVLIDCEHGNIDDHNMYLQIGAISSSGVSPIVRVPASEPWMIKRALDAGAHAIMVPMCETKEQAEQIVQSAKYPSQHYPDAFRGTGAMFAPAAFNLSGRDYLLKANDNVMICVQIESRKAVENVKEIASVEGIDMLFIGPNDLASSLGYVAFDHATMPEVQEATQKILDATLEAAAQKYKQGFHFVNCGADIVALTTSMSTEIQKTKELTKQTERNRPLEARYAEYRAMGLESIICHIAVSQGDFFTSVNSSGRMIAVALGSFSENK